MLGLTAGGGRGGAHRRPRRRDAAVPARRHRDAADPRRRPLRPLRRRSGAPQDQLVARRGTWPAWAWPVLAGPAAGQVPHAASPRHGGVDLSGAVPPKAVRRSAGGPGQGPEARMRARKRPASRSCNAPHQGTFDPSRHPASAPDQLIVCRRAEVPPHRAAADPDPHDRRRDGRGGAAHRLDPGAGVGAGRAGRHADVVRRVVVASSSSPWWRWWSSTAPGASAPSPATTATAPRSTATPSSRSSGRSSPRSCWR